MSRRAIHRQRQQDDKEKSEREKKEKERKEAEKKKGDEEEHDLQMKQEDFWIINNSFITRVHRRPRTSLYVPSEEDFPLPLKYIDIMRFTRTNTPERK